jgi:putative ABC transport system ATP-binding protein
VRIRDGRVSEEATRARGGDELVVIGRGGWLRLPEELLARAGIRSRAFARFERGRLVIVPPEPATRQRRVAPRLPARASPAATATVAELEGLGKTFSDESTKRTVLDHLTASFETGKLHVVTGRSGSGKTTLLHLLAGLALPTAGDVRILGVSLPRLTRSERARFRREHVGIVTQQVGLIPFLTAREVVEFALAIRGMSSPDGSGAVAGYFSLLGLVDRSGQRAGRLSAGEQIRVALTGALAVEPTLLLVDEPTSRLDQANARVVAAALVEIARARNVAVVCATHDPVVIEQADRELRLA